MSQNILETRDSPLNKNFTESFLKDSFELNYENAQRQTNNFSFEFLFLPYLINTFFYLFMSLGSVVIFTFSSNTAYVPEILFLSLENKAYFFGQQFNVISVC